MGPVAGKVSRFEIAATDMERARDFYSGLFGWPVQGDPGVYLWIPAGEGGGAPGGILPAPPETGPYATFGVEVDDVDAAHDRAVELGATTVVPPTDNPGGVRSAYLRDPDGSLFSVYRFRARDSAAGPA
jgi:hypothetical protein